MWGKLMIPMYRLWLQDLCGLHGPQWPLSPKRPLKLNHSFPHLWVSIVCMLEELNPITMEALTVLGACIPQWNTHLFLRHPLSYWNYFHLQNSRQGNFNWFHLRFKVFYMNVWCQESCNYRQDKQLKTKLKINSLASGDVIWYHRTWQISIQVMVCCLTASSHYPSQYWSIITELLWHLLD